MKLKPDEEGARVFCGDVEVQREQEGFYPLKFQNQLGRVLIKVKIGEKLINLPEIEVVSSKLKYNEPESVFFYPVLHKSRKRLKEADFHLPFLLLCSNISNGGRESNAPFIVIYPAFFKAKS